MTARQRRRVVEHLKGERVSERHACRLVGFSRVAMWKPLKGRGDADLRARLKQLAERYPRYGYPTLHDLLWIEGWFSTRSGRIASTGKKGFRSERIRTRTIKILWGASYTRRPDKSLHLPSGYLPRFLHSRECRRILVASRLER